MFAVATPGTTAPASGPTTTCWGWLTPPRTRKAASANLSKASRRARQPLAIRFAPARASRPPVGYHPYSDTELMTAAALTEPPSRGCPRRSSSTGTGTLYELDSGDVGSARPRRSGFQVAPLRRKGSFDVDGTDLRAHAGASNYMKRYRAAINNAQGEPKSSYTTTISTPSPTGPTGPRAPAMPVQRGPTRTHWLSMQVADDGAKMATLGLILGLPVNNTEDGCTVKRILPGNRAWLSCSIKIGDEIISVGGVSARGLAVSDVATLLEKTTADALLAATSAKKKLRLVVRREAPKEVPDYDTDVDDAGSRLGPHRW